MMEAGVVIYHFGGRWGVRGGEEGDIAAAFQLEWLLGVFSTLSLLYVLLHCRLNFQGIKL